MPNALLRLPRTVWLLGLVSLLNDSASELLYPLIPLYLASVLMAGPKALGIIEGIAEMTASLLKLFSGVLTDRTRSAKPWVVGGYGLAALARPLFAFASSWPLVLALRFADRVGKGLRSSPRDALLARSIEPGQRGLAFGLHRAMDNAGAVIGPLLAAGLLAAGVGVRDIFLWAALPGTLAVALALAVREQATPAAATRPAFDWRLTGFTPTFRRYLLALALFTLGNASNMVLLLRAREAGLPDAQVPLLWALVSAVAMLLSTPLSALSDRVGRQRLIVGGWAVYGLLQNTKFTALLFVPLFALVVAVALWLQWRTIDRRLLAQLLVAYPAAALLTLWATNGFQAGPLNAPLPLLGDLGGRVVPLSHYLDQLLDIGGRLQVGTPAFLLGRYSDSGWWWYFPVAFLVKTPLPILLLLLFVLLRIAKIPPNLSHGEGDVPFPSLPGRGIRRGSSTPPSPNPSHGEGDPPFPSPPGRGIGRGSYVFNNQTTNRSNHPPTRP